MIGRAVRGVVFDVVDVAQMQVPEEILSAKRLEIAVAVAHYQPEGEPWGRYGIFLIAPGEGTRA